MNARYTVRDPHFEIICSQCRYGTHECAKRIELPETGLQIVGIPPGIYRCGCTGVNCG